MSLDQVTVVIVTYKSAHCLRDLAPSLRAFPHVVIVDNGSEDDIATVQPQYLPQAQLLQLPHNRGFGAANNTALRQLTTPYALLLNPDCQIDAPSALALLEVAATWPEAAIITPQVVKPDGSLELSYRWGSRLWPALGPAAEAPCCVGFVTGACMLLRVQSFHDIGFFDEDFFLYYEDEDLCQRVFNVQRSIVVAPQVRVVHASRSSVKEGFPWRSEYIRGYHHAQSKLIFEAKHGEPGKVQGLRWRVLSLALLSLPLRLLWPQPRYLVRLLGRIAGLYAYQPRTHQSATHLEA